jgi:hypothetical protein
MICNYRNCSMELEHTICWSGSSVPLAIDDEAFMAVSKVLIISPFINIQHCLNSTSIHPPIKEAFIKQQRN